MRGLIIGLGSIGSRHLENLARQRPGMELAVLRRPESPPLPPAANEVRVIHTLEPDLASRTNFAIIATPPRLHLAALVLLLRAGVACYIEKPLVADDGQLTELRGVLRQLKTLPSTAVGCNLRHLPSLRRLQALVLQGAVGTVVRVLLTAGQWLPDWRPGRDYRQGYGAQRDQGGGVILDLVHEIDQARWHFGEFTTVRAVAGKYSSLKIDSEDTACILLGRPEGPVVSVNLDYVSRRPVRRYEIVGDRGSLIWDLGAQRLDLVTAGGLENIDCGPGGFDVAATYVSAMAEFLDCVEGRRAASSQDIFDGMRSTELALKAREAAGL
jgi:predicted dehydrogenase